MSRRTSILLLLLLFGLFSLFTRGCKTTEPEPDEPVTTAPPSESATDIREPIREFRAVWIATVANIDWPSSPGLEVSQQKEELIDILDRAAALHFNAVIFQVRPAADALYRSSLEPWSSFLTGKMGQAPLPGYDPLEFAVEEAHKRGLELHAWFNPYRAGHPSDRSEISADHVSHTNPDYVVEYGDFLWLDPGLPEVREHTKRVVMDVVERYDIDAVHFDDYFYPYPSYDNGADFPDSLSWNRAVKNGVTLSRDDWRRQNVNKLIRELSVEIKELKPHVKFGISPFGIWQPGYPENTTGFNAYRELYADARHWLKEGWVDYLSPQLYYRITQVPQPFPVMLNWWVDQNVKGRHIWPGHFTGRIRDQNRYWPPYEILGQVYTAKAFSGVTGSIHFSMKTFMENPENFNESIAAGPHANAAAVPESPWIDLPAPSEPIIRYHDYGTHWNLYLEPSGDETVKWWSVKTEIDGKWEQELFPGHHKMIRFEGGAAMVRPRKVMVTAVGRSGMESAPVTILTPLTLQEKPDSLIPKPENLIPREEWATRPAAGMPANAVVKRMGRNDTLRFRDLTLIVDELMQSMSYPAQLMGIEDETTTRVEQQVSKTATLKLYKNGVSETLKMSEGEALNWYGYHIGIPDHQTGNKGSLIEVAAVPSLSVERAAFRSTGDASDRFRVPHRVRNSVLFQTVVDSALTDEETIDFLNNRLMESQENNHLWDVPYHYIVTADGMIYEGREQGRAGSPNFGYDPRGRLMISLIEFAGQDSIPEAQLEALADLLRYAFQKFGLYETDILLHEDLVAGAKPNADLKNILQNRRLIRLIEAHRSSP